MYRINREENQENKTDTILKICTYAIVNNKVNFDSLITQVSRLASERPKLMSSTDIALEATKKQSQCEKLQ